MKDSRKLEIPVYQRIVIKVSGESLGGEHYAIDFSKFTNVAQMIASVHSIGVAVTAVVGGGNIFRGGLAELADLRRDQADEVGMAATGVNVSFLEKTLNNLNIDTSVFSRGPTIGIGTPYNGAASIREALGNGAVVLLAGGLGIPGYSTDVAAVHAAIDTHSPAIVMSKNGVDGIYSSDPNGVDKDSASPIDSITASEAIRRQLHVTDMLALRLARDHGKLIHVIPASEVRGPEYVLEGKQIGSIFSPE